MTAGRRVTAGFAVALASAGVGLALALFACSSDDSSGADGGVDDQNLGTCQTGYPTDGGKFPLSALPSGTACTGATSCTLPVDTCAADLASANGGVNLTEYECDCLGGGWTCYAAVVVDDSCADASAVVADDAGTDGAAVDGASPEASVDAGADAATEASAGDASEDAPASDDGGSDASDASGE
jgi:hypothetical protein